jgi:hypothetical protein
MLDLTSLTNALNSLEKAIKRSIKHPEDIEVRDAVCCGRWNPAPSVKTDKR